MEKTISHGTWHRPPWLLISQGEDHEKQSFYDISEHRLYTTSIPQLHGKCVVDSAYGWLVLSDRKTDECCLWNPWSTEIIELPKLEKSYLFITCKLSKPPTDSDCHILFNSLGSKYQAFCRVGDDKYVMGTQDHISLETSISFKGEIYGIKIACNPDDPVPKFVTVHFNFTKEILELRPLVTEQGQVWELDVKSQPWMRFTKYYLVRSLCGDELFLVQRMSGGVFDQTAFNVFRVDFQLKEFVKMYNLGGEAIFLSFIGVDFNGGSWCCSSQGTQANCIYYTVKGSRNLYIYDLNDQSTSFLLPCPDQQSNMYWVEHQVFHA